MYVCMICTPGGSPPSTLQSAEGGPPPFLMHPMLPVRAGIPNLVFLDLYANAVEDISPVAAAASLRVLMLGRNSIRVISVRPTVADRTTRTRQEVRVGGGGGGQEACPHCRTALIH